jgi:hypothetical protein
MLRMLPSRYRSRPESPGFVQALYTCSARKAAALPGWAWTDCLQVAPLAARSIQLAWWLRMSEPRLGRAGPKIDVRGAPTKLASQPLCDEQIVGESLDNERIDACGPLANDRSHRAQQLIAGDNPRALGTDHRLELLAQHLMNHRLGLILIGRDPFSDAGTRHTARKRFGRRMRDSRADTVNQPPGVVAAAENVIATAGCELGRTCPDGDNTGRGAGENPV